MRGSEAGRVTPADLAPDMLTGHAAETGTIQRLLRRVRLVTATGPPGVGKTAVSMTAVAAIGEAMTGDTCVVRLDSVWDEAGVTRAIVTALGMGDNPYLSPIDVLFDGLGDRRLLLVIDTCEHMVGACATLVMLLLPSCPGLRILATSREPLRVPGESTVMVTPLPEGQAVELFAQRAAAHSAGFAVTPENWPTIADICARLDGLPLGIELAARQLGSMTLPRLKLALREGYDFLSNPDAATARQQTLRAAIGWSHQLCTPVERLLWARLAVFSGWFTLSDAREVCAGRSLPADSIGESLGLLAERSVLLADRQADGLRYALPATIRAFGMTMLRRLEEDEEQQCRHKRWLTGTTAE